MKKSNTFKWIAAVVLALLVSYLRVTGYLPESEHETANENQTAGQTAAGSEHEGSSALTRDGFCRTTY